VARHEGAVPPPGVEGLDLALALEPVVADDENPLRQIKLMRLVSSILVHVGPVGRHQPIERVPQREVTAVEHSCPP
jgi:hypothetical protein